jgi:site-specific DNA-methyltransferase (adenine-specific)
MASRPHWTDGSSALYIGDCLTVLPELGDGSADAVVTDPPYGLEFMGAEWDRFGDQPGYRERARLTVRPDSQVPYGRGGGVNSYQAGTPYQAWCERWARECVRVLKPGGYLLAFGGTRTWHRLACALEDAGFEIRDSTADLTGRHGAGLLWLYGQGFPKSRDIGKAIDRAAGAERPVTAEGTPQRRMIPGADQNRTGSWIKDDGREYVPATTRPATAAAAEWDGWGTALKPAWEPIIVARKPFRGTVEANVLEHGTGALNLRECAVQHDGAAGRWPPNVVMAHLPACEPLGTRTVRSDTHYPAARGESGYEGGWHGQAELAEQSPREEQVAAWACAAGCPVAELDAQTAGIGGASRFMAVFRYEAKAGAAERPRLPDGTMHPTVKPAALMAWLVRLVTRPGGLVVDPFAGSGTTGEACLVEGRRFVLIEQDPRFAGLITQRLHRPAQLSLFDPGD